MKNLVVFSLVFSISICLYSQDEKTKSGWSFGAVPVVAFDCAGYF